jgi:two-component system repressor protein LuxO
MSVASESGAAWADVGAGAASVGLLPTDLVTARVLVVEDTPTQAELARALLRGMGHDVRLASTAGEAFAAARSWRPEAILLDIELPDYNGFELFRQLRADGIDAEVIVVTADGSHRALKESMRLGAWDYVVKPYNKLALATPLQQALKKRGLERRLAKAEESQPTRRFQGFIGASPAMSAAYQVIRSVAASKASVFITGESGTGKELAAEAVHKSSPRAERPFVALNCGAIPRDLLESEVFGHVKGAFTGATGDRVGAAKLADGGTLFLDEIGEMPLEMQVKLLRFVQTGTFAPVGASRLERVDVRFVCATNRDPMLEVQAGRFREDLYYRLYVVPIELPPLRNRGDDVLLIARHFLAQFSREEQRHFRAFTPAAEQALMAYSWPGNVRQLQNVVRNVVVLHADGEWIDVNMLPPPVVARPGYPSVSMVQQPPPPAPPAVAPAPPSPIAEALAPLTAPLAASFAAPLAPPPTIAPTSPAEAAWVNDDSLYVAEEATRPPLPPQPPAEPEIVPLAVMERRLILAALRRTNSDVPRAAALLQINPSTVYRKLQTWKSEGLPLEA